jgi:siroheme synthase-like protein
MNDDAPTPTGAYDPPLFPVFLRLSGRPVLVVGGGSRALEKIPALLEAGARVRVVAPTVSDEVAALADAGRLVVDRRAFRPADLDDAWYVVAGAPPAVNAEVACEAHGRRLWLNAVDDVAHATAWLGAKIRHGGFTFAISSHGHAPALAALVRRGLESLLPPEMDRWFALAEERRDRDRAAKVPFPERRRGLFEAIRALYDEPSQPSPGASTSPAKDAAGPAGEGTSP